MNKPRERGQKSLGRSFPKGRGKEVEFRTKKQKNELHILKMSQEWDLRRQKRRLDRQKWVEERRNQKLPIWQRVGNLRVQANEEIIHDTGNELVNKTQQIQNSNEATQTKVINGDKVKENSLEPRGKETGNEFLVQTSRLPENKVQGTSCGVSEQKKDTEIKFIKIEQARTIEQPLLYNVNTLKTSKTSAQITEHGSITAFKNPSQSPSRQDGEHRESGKSTEIVLPETGRRSDVTSVTLQKLLRMERTNGESEKPNRKRKLEAIVVDGNIREMPSLLRVNKPTTLENIERENGPVVISSSANNSVVIKTPRGMDHKMNGKGEELMPQIKQFYSLLDRREESPNVNFFAAKQPPSNSIPGSVSRVSPVTMTTSPSEVKGQVALPSVPVDPKCVVYLAKAPAPAPTPGAPSHPRPGYLVPVFKASTKEAAYAFLPAGAQRPHRVGDKSGLEGRTPNRKSECGNSSCTTVVHHVTRPYSSANTMTCLKEVHTGCVPATGKFVSGSQASPALYGDHAHQNTRVISCYEPSSTAVTLNPSRTVSASINGGLAIGSRKNHPQKTKTAHSIAPLSTGSTAPLAQEIKGAQTAQDMPRYPAFCRSPEVPPNQTALNAQEAIFNPMSVYVRAKLVPREVVAVNHGTEPSPPLVEYIKTDAICDKELTKWSARNVADFIAATDCADKAELFLEQEIDGKALLSLSPEMLMKGMNLKLGPSVKLYNHITNLRTALLH